MTLHRTSLAAHAFVIGLVSVMSACSDPTSSLAVDYAHIRIVNGLMRAGTGTATPVAIDYLIDSSTALPGIANLGALGISTADSANGFRDISGGVHTFLARVAGDTSALGNVYTTSTNLPYLPHQRLVGSLYYTAVVTGVLPATGTIANNTVRFQLGVDDPFPGYSLNGAFQARFNVVNAAPYTNAAGTGANISVYVYGGTTLPPGAITTYLSKGTASYASQSAYFDVTTGASVVTLVAGGNIIYQQVFTFNPGEVWTFVVQSTGSGAPSATNHRVTPILDQSYAP